MATSIYLWAFSFSILALWLGSCSEQPCPTGCYKSLELTPQSLSHFAARFKGNSADPLIARLRKCPLISDCHQQLFFKYIIGSSAVLGCVDEESLRFIYELCRSTDGSDLIDLLEQLIEQNGRYTVVQFIALNITRRVGNSILRFLMQELMGENWKAVEALVTDILAVLNSNRTRRSEYHSMLGFIPVERQYEMICAGKMTLDTFGNVHSIDGANVQVRKIFLLARCSDRPNPQVRNYIASQASYFRQFIATNWVPDKAMAPCHGNGSNMDLNAYIWEIIFMLLDVESLIFVVPSVCTAWCRLYKKALKHSTDIHDLYLQDLDHFELSVIHTIIPWRRYLSDEVDALNYLGWCIADGTLSRIRPTSLQSEVKEYLRIVADGKVLLPKIQGCASVYDSYLRLFEMIYEFCADPKPSFDKPDFLTNEEYERAVYHLVCGKKWIPKLSKSLVIDDLPKLFSVIKEDEELMKKLIIENFGDFVAASKILIMHGGQANDVPNKLAKLVFSQTDLFKGLVEPLLTCPSGYYDFIAKSGIFPEFMMGDYDTSKLNQFVVSFILSLRGDPIAADKLVTSMTDHLLGLEGWRLKHMQLRVGFESFRFMRKLGKYSSEEAEFVEEIMRRCKLLSLSSM